jgi:uncharacterized protein
MKVGDPMTLTDDKKDISIHTDDGTVLRGWFFSAQGKTSPAPLVLLHDGFGGVKEGHLERFARGFAQAGFNALGYDPRGLGESGGRVRNEIDPAQYVADFRDAITFGASLPGVDAKRIGVWGSSYGGGIAIQTGALDTRISCVVAQVPFLSGGARWRAVPAERKARLKDLFAGERALRAGGHDVMTMKIVSRDPQREPSILDSPDSFDWCMATAKEGPNWRNEVTVRSLEMVFGFEPIAHILGVSPRPLLILAAENDALMPFEDSRRAFATAGEPKAFVVLPCGHFDPYKANFEQSFGAARDWFQKHL